MDMNLIFSVLAFAFSTFSVGYSLGFWVGYVKSKKPPAVAFLPGVYRPIGEFVPPKTPPKSY